MPSLRQFAAQQNISMTTAIRTYELMQEQGYLCARVKSGFYVTKPHVAENSLDFEQFTSEVRTLSVPSQHRQSQLNNLLSTAQVAPELMPLDSLRRCFKYAADRQSDTPFLYGNSQGSLALRESLAGHYSRKGLALDAGQLLITGGCIHAVTLALQSVTKPGDCVAVASPCYQGLLQVLSLLGRKVIEIPSNQSGLDLKQLADLSDKGMIQACLLSANYQNPTGHCLSTEQKQWLAEFAAQKQLPIIEDDVFGELVHIGTNPLPIKAWDSEGYVIWCGSASKTLAPGLRIGWCAPGRFLALMTERLRVTTMGLNDMVQFGLARFIQTGNYGRHLQRLNRQLAAQVAQYRDYLMANLADDIAVSNPNGGLVLWLKLPNVDIAQVILQAQELGFELRGGGLFTSRELYRQHLRINAGWPFSHAKKWLDLMIDLIDKNKR